MNQLLEQVHLTARESEGMIKTLKEWSAINTHSSNLEGLEKMVGILESAAEPLQGKSCRIELPKRTIVNEQGETSQVAVGKALQIKKRPQAQFQMLLAGHYDTVFETEGPFQKAIEKNSNRLCGPGVADMKGGILIMFASLAILEKSPLAKNIGWQILLTPDEEIGSPCSEQLYKNAAKESHIGLIFEPSFPDGSLVSARKASANFIIVAKGRAAHAGRDFHAGRNAIAALAYFAVYAHSLNNQFPDVTVNVGKISGGEASNIVPKLASCHVNVRANSSEELDTIEKLLDGFTHDAAKSISRDLEGIELSMHLISRRGPKVFDEASQKLFAIAKQCGHQLGLEVSWKKSGGVSDGNILSQAGLPTIDTLGAVGGHLHTYEEYIEISSLAERTRLAALLLLTLANRVSI